MNSRKGLPYKYFASKYNCLLQKWDAPLENNLWIQVSVVLLTRYYRLSLGNGENIILRLIKTEPRKSVRIVAQLLVKKRYRKEFTGVILAATLNREIRHQRR